MDHDDNMHSLRGASGLTPDVPDAPEAQPQGAADVAAERGAANGSGMVEAPVRDEPGEGEARRVGKVYRVAKPPLSTFAECRSLTEALECLPSDYVRRSIQAVGAQRRRNIARAATMSAEEWKAKQREYGHIAFQKGLGKLTPEERSAAASRAAKAYWATQTPDQRHKQATDRGLGLKKTPPATRNVQAHAADGLTERQKRGLLSAYEEEDLPLADLCSAYGVGVHALKALVRDAQRLIGRDVKRRIS